MYDDPKLTNNKPNDIIYVSGWPESRALQIHRIRSSILPKTRSKTAAACGKNNNPALLSGFDGKETTDDFAVD